MSRWGIHGSNEVAETMTAHADTLIRFACSKCGTQLRAMPAQIGRTLACPKCGAANEVPGETPSSTAESAASTHVHRHQKDVPVVCGLCSTRMYASRDEIGQEIKCPDCGTLTQIKEPTKPRPAGVNVSPPVEVGDEYQLRDDEDSFAPQRDDTKYFVYFCKLCSTQMRATIDDVGQTVECPDCELEMEIPAPAIHNDAPAPVDEDPELAIGAAEEVKQAELMEHEKLRVVDGAATAPAGLRRDYGYADDPDPPEYPFASRVFSFLFYRTTRPNWLALGLMFAPLWYAMGVALEMSEGAAAERGLALLMFVSTFMFSIVWGSVAAACLLTIVNETAAGNDEIVEWPELLDITSWVVAAFYGVNALAVSAAPAAILSMLVGVPPLWIPVVAVAAVYLVLPPVLLSMLANGSPLGIVSAEINQRMRMNAGACVRFYAATGLVYAVVLGSCYALLQLHGFMAAMAAGVLVAMGTFLVARLIGRLGWVLSQEPTKPVDEATDAASVATDQHVATT
ncbi:MAG: hypothetical protein MI757_19175 [Pirellulales bacterium]|nr:hypothetical protein [Pirellulales bacterium]